MSRRIKEISSIVLTTLIGIFTNIATGSLPEEWRPYLWLSWLPLGICVVVVIAFQFLPERRNAAQSPSAHSNVSDAIKAAVARRTINTGGGDYAEGNIDKRQGVFVSGGTVHGPVIGHNAGTVNTTYSSLEQEAPIVLRQDIGPDAQHQQLNELQRRLGLLEIQNARQGYGTDPAILMEIEDLQQQVADLKKQLGVSEAS